MSEEIRAGFRDDQPSSLEDRLVQTSVPTRSTKILREALREILADGVIIDLTEGLHQTLRSVVEEVRCAALTRGETPVSHAGSAADGAPDEHQELTEPLTLSRMAGGWGSVPAEKAVPLADLIAGARALGSDSDTAARNVLIVASGSATGLTEAIRALPSELHGDLYLTLQLENHQVETRIARAIREVNLTPWHLDGTDDLMLFVPAHRVGSVEMPPASWVAQNSLIDAGVLRDMRTTLHSTNLKYRQAMNLHAALKDSRRQLAEDLARAESALGETQSERDLLRKELAQQRMKAAEARKQVVGLRQSLTYRTGQEIRRAGQVPLRLFALPYRLLRLVLSGRSLPVDADEGVQERSDAAETAVEIREPSASSQPGKITLTRRQEVDPVGWPREGHHFSDLPDLRVAAILDEFSAAAFSPDCRLTNLSRNDWRSEIEESQPELLLVESAWRGHEGTWHNAVSQYGAELRGILQWCRARSVPTVFWNKEDPVHFSTFLTVASRFDAVFTTDIDCIARYKALLGHERVYLLPFAVQPLSHNPIETVKRKEAISFAGAYYKRYPERIKDLDGIISGLSDLLQVDIYDRNLGSDDPNYTFPVSYRRHIVGTLAPAEIWRSYRGYHYALNLNSVKQSQSMFARRVFELLASNTITVSNFSRGVQLFFGDIVVVSDSGRQIAERVRGFMSDLVLRDKTKLEGLRSVMTQHTYEHRLRYILQQLGAPTGGIDQKPSIALIGVADTIEEHERLIGSMDRQVGVSVLKYVVSEKIDRLPARPGVVLIDSTSGAQKISDLVSAPLIGLVSAHDYYGSTYALDLWVGTKFGPGDVFGKVSRYVSSPGVPPVIAQPGNEYRSVSSILRKTSLAKLDYLGDWTLADFVRAPEQSTYEGQGLLSMDRFGYLELSVSPDPDELALVDNLVIDTGVPLRQLLEAGESTAAVTVDEGHADDISPAQLASWFKDVERPSVKHTTSGGEWEVESTLGDGAHDYLYARGSVPISKLWPSGDAEAYVDAEPGLNLQVVFIFHDSEANRLGAFFATSQKNATSQIPEGAVAVKLGLRIQGPGIARIRRIGLQLVDTDPTVFIATSRHLIVTNHYPSHADLYRNGFVHSRARAYAAAGHRPDVFRVRAETALRYEEFEGIRVFTGSAEALERILGEGTYESALVHFLDEEMWGVLKHCTGVAIRVWIHGAEVQPWWRRSYNFTTDDALANAKAASALRMEFWQEVFKSALDNVHFVFVSRYFAEEVIADVGVDLESSSFSIIHNPIDTSIFAFAEKNPELRKKILSIRPFASAKYANDLSVAAILELASEPWFSELEFLIVGDGPLFDTTLEPLRDFENVTTRRGFLTQSEISELHAEFGIFLVPTRMDAQGVSRDEAMASGLVPITNGVAAVPEFVDDASGFLAEPDDASGLARGIKALYEDASLFERMSAAAAQRVRAQSDSTLVIQKELALFAWRLDSHQPGLTDSRDL